VALIIGGEEKGMRPLVRKNCDHLVSIPHVGPVDSLNASVAAALAVYEVLRQRLSARRPRR
jgi:23S rRNA (guanosine2251-2'-O)-methyltransferase